MNTCNHVYDHINEILRKLGWIQNDFITSAEGNTIVITRIVDQKRVSIDISNIKPKCITDSCESWLRKLRELIIDGFVSEPKCEPVLSPASGRTAETILYNPTILTTPRPVSLAAPKPVTRSISLAEPKPVTRPIALAQTDIIVDKTSDKPDYEPGEDITFIYSIRNIGTDVYVITNLSDFFSDLPPGEFTEVPPGAIFTNTAWVLTLGNRLLPGDILEFRAVFHIAADASLGPYANRIGVFIANEQTIFFTLNFSVFLPNVSVVKTALQKRIGLGQSVGFNYTITNNTDLTYVLRTMVDTVDGSVGTFDTIPTGAVRTPNGFTLDLNRTLGPRQVLTLFASLTTFINAVPSTYTNQVVVIIDTLGDIVAIDQFTIVPLLIEKTADKQIVTTGDTIHFTYRIHNTSTDQAFTLRNLVDQLNTTAGTFTVLPPNATLIPNGFVLVFNGGLVLNPLQQITLSATLRAGSVRQTTYVNTITVTADDVAPLRTDVEFVISNFSISKDQQPSELSTGDTIIFTIRIKNESTNTQTVGATLVDTITSPGEFTVVPPGAETTADGFRLDLANQTLVGGQSLQYMAIFRIATNATAMVYTNTATLTSPTIMTSAVVDFTVKTGWILSVITRGVPQDNVSIRNRINLQEVVNVSIRNRINPQQLPVEITHIYDSALIGFSFNGTQAEAEALSRDFPELNLTSDIVAPISGVVGPEVNLRKQQVGAFAMRTGAIHSSVRNNELANRSDINLFIIDTGIYPHADLNVVGGINVSLVGENADWVDRNSHGTHVAGIAGAINNNIGIVGVAPSVRLWAVKTVRDDGTATLSNALAGMDWILRNKDTLWSGYGIINASLSIPKNMLINEVVDVMASNGIPVIVKAGDLAQNTDFFSPSSATGAIVVGSTGNYPLYDTLSNFSNVGDKVALLAPGECIISTLPDNKYGIRSGTGTSAPMVAGTVAILLATGEVLGTGAELVANLKRRLICDSKKIKQNNADGTKGCNYRINTRGKPITNISVWAGAY